MINESRYTDAEIDSMPRMVGVLNAQNKPEKRRYPKSRFQRSCSLA
jgi:hypothetical protein